MAPRTVPPTPLTSLTIDSRCGRRKFTARRPSGEAAYFIVAPPTWAATSGDHHKTYLALVYRGDNPKYNPTSQLVGMVRRGTWWKTVTQTLHGAVARDAKVLEKETLTRKLKIKNRCRKLVCMGAKRLEWEEGCESLQPVQDHGSQVVMTHTGHRRYTVDVEGVEYRLTGTRMYGWQKKVKGCALSTKLVRVRDGALVAALDTEIGWRKKMGTLNIFVSTGEAKGEAVVEADAKAEPVGGQMDGQMVLQLLWTMAEAEYRKRDLIMEIIIEILENASG